MNTAKNVLFLAMLGATAYFAPIQEAAAYNKERCKVEARACAGFTTGSLFICAVAALESGVNPVADFPCAKLFDAALGSCALAGLECAPNQRVQPMTTQIVGGELGATQTSPGTTTSTKTCSGSHRVVGFFRFKNSAGNTTLFSLLCSGGTGPTGATLDFGKRATGDSFDAFGNCPQGHIMQGFDVGWNGQSNVSFVRFTGKCDHFSRIADTDVVVGAGGTRAAVRLCPEKSYIVGATASSTSSGQLSKLLFLCRKLPGTP